MAGACCFSGHRDLNAEQMKIAADAVYVEVENMYRLGVRRFYCGGAKGFDMVAGIMVNNMRLRFPKLELVIALPYIGHSDSWSASLKGQLQTLAKYAFGVVTVTEGGYKPGCMQTRNRYLVDNSTRLIAWYDGRKGGGTAYTIKYAESVGVEVVNLYREASENVKI